MMQATQVALAERALEHIEASTKDLAPGVTVHPVQAYTSQTRLREEKAKLLLEEPLLLTLSCRLLNPGDYVTDDHTGVPLLAIRGDDEQVRVFVNACRHRGSRLVDGDGRARRLLSCPYHAWSYDLTGRLVKIPDADSFAEFDSDGCSLEQLPSLERDGLVWARADSVSPIDLDDHLAGLGPELASYRFADYHHYVTHRIECRMNWKIVIDTFLEPYHFGVLHRATVGPIFIPNLCLLDTFGRNLREVLPRRSIESLRTLPRRDWDLLEHSAIVYVLFPNTVLVIQKDHAEIWRCFPLDERPERSVAVMEFYVPQPVTGAKARRHWDANVELLLRTVVEEDFPIGEGAQQGYLARTGGHVVFGRNEPALAHFETAIARALEARRDD